MRGPISTTRVSPNFGTSSGVDPEEDFKVESASPQLEAEIPRGSRTPTGGLLPGKAVPRSPIGIEIGGSAGGGLNITGTLPIGGPISARGGVNIGKDGAIKGGQVGLGVGVGPIGASIDIGTDADSEGRGGCYQYVTVSIGPFSHTYGKNVCEPKPKKQSEPNSSIPTTPKPDDPFPIEIPDSDVRGWVFVHIKNNGINLPYQAFSSSLIERKILSPIEERIGGLVGRAPMKLSSMTRRITPNPTTFPEVILEKNGVQLFVHQVPVYAIATRNSAGFFESKEIIRQNASSIYFTGDKAPLFFWGSFKEIRNFLKINNEQNKIKREAFPENYSEVIYIPFAFIPYSGELPTEIPDPLSIPNPPPRKKMDDKCCKAILLLQLETLRLLGREVGPQGLMPQTKNPGFIGEEIERVETPISNPEKPKKIKIRFDTIYELLRYSLQQANNLDVALDPQSYQPPTGKVQNPLYNRDSEKSLKSNAQPDRDKSGNKRELEINKDDEVQMGGFLQQHQYVFDALRRLEYLFPFGELDDAVIAKDLLIPGGKGDIRIHNIIMAYEVQMMYLNATFGNPREVLTIKDANPAIEGDQPIEVAALTLSDWFRQVVKFQVDTGGDVDAAVNLLLRDFRTNLANRTDIIKTAEMTQALFEDSGMRESQDYIKVHLEGDPYAGQWVKGQGFQANADLEKKTEEATEKVLRETMKPTEIKLKVSRRHEEEKTDMRDLLRGLADFVQRLLSIPSAGDAGAAIDKLIESAKFKVQTEAALLRANVMKAASASRNRTKKRKK